MSRRILFVNTPTYMGGAEVSLLTLMKNLSADRYLPYVVTSGDGTFTRQALDSGIPVAVQAFPWFSRRKPWEYAYSVYQLVRTIQINDIQLIHTNCDHSLRYVMYASKLACVPYVSHVRDFVRSWFQPDKVVALNLAARVIANSAATASACKQAGIDTNRITTIYNPVDIEAFQKTPSTASSELRAKLNIPSQALVVGIIGQIQPIKGHQEFVKAAIRLADEIQDVHFLVAGSVPPSESDQQYSKNVKIHIQQSKYANRFHFLGFRSDIPVVMKAIDILAVPSYTESFGRVIVEGLAAGCAVVGTNVGGVPEIISNDIDGLLVSPKDVDALFAAMKRLALSLEVRQQFAQTGQLTSQRFTIANHVQQIHALYEQVISAH